MNTTHLPCTITFNTDGTVDFSGMTPEFAEAFIGCAMLGSTSEKDFAQYAEGFCAMSLVLSPDPDDWYEE